MAHVWRVPCRTHVLLTYARSCTRSAQFVFTALMIASTQGELDSIEVLLAAGANLDAKDKFGKTALDKARQCGHADAVKLLESGPSVAGSSSKSEGKRPAPEADDDEDDEDEEEEEEEEEEAPTKKVKTGPLKQGWREIIDDEGDSYYWNDATGESTWEAPLA